MTQPATTAVKCLPTYILLDTSSSMEPAQDTLNQTVESLYDELSLNPSICDFVHASIVTFSDDAHVVLGMTDIQELTALPVIKCAGVTNFNRAFQVLRSCIDRDVDHLNAGREVLRPVVFVLTDGQPTDERGYKTEAWRSDYARLVDRGWRRRPNVVPFGFGAATREVIRDMATIDGAAFLAKDPDNADSLKRIFATLLSTLVASAHSNELRLPKEVDGFVTVNQDIID